MCNSKTQPQTQFSTLIELLRDRAATQGQQRAYTFLDSSGTEAQSLTYGELDRQARAIAAHLQPFKAVGERAILLYPSGLEFIAAFFGCLYAGVIAVPAYPPRRHQKLSRVQAIATNAQARWALTTTHLLASIRELCSEDAELSQLQWIATDSVDLEAAPGWQRPAISRDTLAFLQYTSGSTGDPKGVRVSHQNILHNERVVKAALGSSDRTVPVGWLPLFHDMGLIGNVLQPLYLGVSCYLMSPADFLQKPIRWLRAICRYRATSSGGPNFAYDLCLRRTTPAQRAGLDLSSWEVAFTGAEPIQAETLERFSAVFAPYGFRRTAFYPCYGMAESTLFISGGRPQAPTVTKTVDSLALTQNRVVSPSQSAVAQTVVACGQTWLDQSLCIVDPDTRCRCGPDQVGEIWVAGPSVALGYWQRPEQTIETFQAFTADTPPQGPFLRTGDLGFLQDGALFVTGRLKDLIIIRGQNHYPQDIELTVENSHPALRAGGGAAFSVLSAESERLVIVHELERRYLRQPSLQEVLDSIRQAVAARHNLQIYAAVLVKPSSIPKTSSGKIRRYACRAAFLTGSLAAVEHWGAQADYPAAPQALATLSASSLP